MPWPSSTTPTSGPAASPPSARPSPSTTGSESGDADSLANRIGGLDLALRRLELDESRDIARYGKQIQELGDPPTIDILNQVIEDEREHYITLGNLIRHHLPPTQLDPDQAKRASTI